MRRCGCVTFLALFLTFWKAQDQVCCQELTQVAVGDFPEIVCEL